MRLFNKHQTQPKCIAEFQYIATNQVHYILEFTCFNDITTYVLVHIALFSFNNFYILISKQAPQRKVNRLCLAVYMRCSQAG